MSDGTPVPPPSGMRDGIVVFNTTCALALLPCPLAGRLILVGPLVGILPSLAGSLPNDMIDRALPWLFPNPEALFGPLPCRGALCRPPLDGTLMTFKERAGLCPFSPEAFRMLVTEAALE